MMPIDFLWFCTYILVIALYFKVMYSTVVTFAYIGSLISPFGCSSFHVCTYMYIVCSTGKEHGVGIFVSLVSRGSQADIVGLKVFDPGAHL